VRLTLAILAAGAALAQTAPDVPTFEVASIKQAAPMTGGRVMVKMGGDPSRVDYSNVTLKDVLARAYNLKRHQVRGPDWLDSERYDITAKVPDGVSKDKIPAMLQNLLAERFKMVVHRESKEQPVYALVVAKGGPKLKKSEDSEADPLPPGVPAGPDGARVRRATMMMNHNGRMEIKRTTLSGFSDMLSNMLDRAVVDQTGVEGQYDIVLDVAMEDLVGMRKMAMGAGHMPGGPGGPGGPGAESGPAPDSAPKASIFTAIQQLGLKLEPRKAPLDHLIIDQAEKVPTAN
jgi:uncharacterized protein (TIGR03435 family)